jgi:hypothetical protein
MKKTIYNGIRFFWISACFAVLIKALIAYHRLSHPEIVLSMLIRMVALSFPSGYIITIPISLLLWLSDLLSIPIGISNTYLSIYFQWLPLFIAGYLQWFKLLPYLINLIRKSQ